MKCEKCNKNEANVFITATNREGTKKYCLCSECAKEIRFKMPQMQMGADLFSPHNVFGGGLFEAMSPMMRMLGMLTPSGPSCETDWLKGDDGIDRGYGNECESTEDKIKNNNAKIKEFSEQIEVLKKENSELDKRLKEENSSEFKIKQLKKKLKNAVKNEYFERAAKIRDEIRELEKGD